MDDVVSLQHEFHKNRELINKIRNHKVPALLIVRGRGSYKFDIHHMLDCGAVTWKRFEKIVDSLIVSNPFLATSKEEYRKLSKQKRIITCKTSINNDDESFLIDSTESLVKALEDYFESFILLENPPDDSMSIDETTQPPPTTDTTAADTHGMIFEISYVPEGIAEILPSDPELRDALLEVFAEVKNSALSEGFSAVRDWASSAGDEEEDLLGSAFGHTEIPRQNTATEQFHATTTEDIRALLDETIEQLQKQMSWWEYTLLKAKYALFRASSIFAGSGNNPDSRGKYPPTMEKALGEEYNYISLAIVAVSIVLLTRKFRPDSSVILSWRANCD